MVGTSLPPTSPANIVLGGYDGSLAGLSLRPDDAKALTLTLKYAYAPHAGAVRAAALSGSTLVTGSTDETIRVYNLARNVEVGTLLQHDGTINALQFADDGREVLFSASDDASICVWRCSDWTCLKRLSGHQSPVLSISVHPSARVALSTSRDRTLFMWDMVKGKIVFSSKTKAKAATSVKWSPDGGHYLLLAGSLVTLSSVEGHSVHTFPEKNTISCSTFLDSHRIAVGGEEGLVKLWDVREERSNAVLLRHGTRVCGLHSMDDLLISADSRGGLKIWDSRMQGQPRIETEVGDGNLMLTCMAAAPVEKGSSSLDLDSKRDMEKSHEHAREQSAVQDEGKSRDEMLNGDSAPLPTTSSQRKRKKRKQRVA